MKTAAITFYEYNDKDKVVVLNNGFSFISNRVEMDHIFVNINDDIKSKVSNYDLVYTSINYTYELHALKKCLDNRFVLGCPFFRYYNKNLDKMLQPATVIRTYFENYLNIPFENRFVSYWSDWINNSNLDIISIQYTSLLHTWCYWRKCTFCYYGESDRYFKSIRRDFETISKDYLEDDRLHYVCLNSGGCYPKEFKTIVDVSRNIRNKIFFVFVRFDDLIFDIIKSCNDLSRLQLAVGLETFSQIGNNLLRKGYNMNNTLECIKMATEKGAEVLCFVGTLLPFMNDEIYKESIKNIYWLIENIDRKDKLIFVPGEQFIWPTTEMASLYGDYKTSQYDDSEYYTTLCTPERIVSVIPEDKKKTCNKIMDFVVQNFKTKGKKYTRLDQKYSILYDRQ